MPLIDKDSNGFNSHVVMLVETLYAEDIIKEDEINDMCLLIQDVIDNYIKDRSERS